MKTRYLLILFALGSGLALVCALGGGRTPIAAAPRAENHIEAPSAPAAELHVCPSGCTYSSIQDAVDAADDGDVIKVATGVYTGVNKRGGLAQVVYITKTVTIRGGYAIDNWTTSDPENNHTTLDAQGQGRGLYITGHISPVIAGLRITGGNSTGLGGPGNGDAGGGVYIITATATFSGNWVFGNTSHDGGGLLLDHSDATLSGNTFTGNTATDDCGGICLHHSDAILIGNTITDNVATNDGGGLVLSHSQATLSGNTIADNRANTDGGGLVLFYSNAKLNGNTVTGNIAADNAGGVYLRYSNAELSGNTITGNTATNDGGGLYLRYSNATLRGNQVINNTGRNGGGLSLYDSDATLINNVVTDNQANDLGSGMSIESSSPRLLHTTIARNTGGDGRGVYVFGSGSTVALTNTILVSHNVGIRITDASTVTINGILWHDVPITVSQSTSPFVTVQNQHVGNPAFVAPNGGDYHIGPGSAAIDEGVDAGVDHDIDGELRPLGSGYDLGADEAGLFVIKQAYPDPVQPGEQLTYTILVTNATDLELHATIRDTLPEHITLGRTKAGTLILPGEVVTWTPVSILPQGVWMDTVVVTVEHGYNGPLVNVVHVTTAEGATGVYTKTSQAGGRTCWARLNDSPYDYTSVQDAVDAAQEGDVVKVAGHCTRVNVRPRNDITTVGTVAQVVYISKTVTIRGGYSIDNWALYDPENNPTTLDAGGQGRVLYITGDISPTVEGLRITGGDATGLGGWGWMDGGGGMYVITATVVISNNWVSNNTTRGRGGGLCLWDSDAVLSNNQVFSNSVPHGRGGGLCLKDSDATLSSNTITSNTAGEGGALYLDQSDATISGNTLSDNTAVDGNGGGLSLWESDATFNGNTITSNRAEHRHADASCGGLHIALSTVTISGNTITDNYTDGDGGGGCLRESNATLGGNTISGNTAGGCGGGLEISGGESTLSSNTIADNAATGPNWWNGGGGLFLGGGKATLRGNVVISNTGGPRGGGLSLYYSNATLSGNTITGNTAVGNYGGGGLFLESSNATVSGNTIIGNTTDGSGGGMYMEWDSDATLINNLVADNQANDCGSGLYIRGSSPHLLHTTIARNTGGDGSGVCITGEPDVAYSIVALTNTILVSHSVGVQVGSSNKVMLESTLWHGNTTNWSGGGTIIRNNDHIGAPVFVDPANGDYHIGPGSAAIDAGVDAGVNYDIDGDPRPSAFGFDIGADEQTGPSLLIHKAVWPSVLKPGQTVTYTLVVTSAQVDAATGVWLTDTLPALQQAVAITTSRGSCTAGAGWGGTATCDLGTLLPGASVHITLTAQVTTTVPAQLPWPMRNTAGVKAIETAGNTSYADTVLQDCRVRLNDDPTEFSTVQAAVDASAQPSDTVKVSGYCVGMTSRAGVAQVVYLDKTLTLQGGWNTGFTEWDVTSFPTTLDAQGQGRVLYITGDISPTVEGLRITGGDTFALAGPDEPFSQTLAGGGGMYIISATATVSNNWIFNNTAGWGGGLCVSGDVTISGNTITSNTANRGGGMIVDIDTATISNNWVSNNTAHGSGGGLLAYGDATISGNTFTSNTAVVGGGGLYRGKDSTALISGNSFIYNTSDRGGGLRLGGGDPTLINNVVADNRANVAGSGLYIDSSSPTLLHNTIARNRGGDGSGVYVTTGYEWGYGLGSQVTLRNTILSGHTVGIAVTNGNVVTLESTLWGSGEWANGTDWGVTGTVSTGTVNLWSDPAFVDPANGDYHIDLGSAAIDEGVDAGVDHDIDGHPRPLGSGYDLGADEVGLAVTKQATPDPVQPGAPLTYTIRVANATGMERHVTITDTLPLSVTLGGTLIPPGGTLTPPGGTVVLPDGRVAVVWTAVITEPSGTWVGTIRVTVNEDAEGPLTNLVEVTTKEGVTGQARAIVNAHKVYLPLVMRNH